MCRIPIINISVSVEPILNNTSSIHNTNALSSDASFNILTFPFLASKDSRCFMIRNTFSSTIPATVHPYIINFNY